MIEMNVIKCHGSSNDFILIDELEQSMFFEDKYRSDFALQLCDRSNGIGADGILFVQKSKTADGKMRIFNSDGSEAAMCGNGLRCVARFLSEKFGRSHFVVETMYSMHKVTKVASIFENMPSYSVEIMPISLDPAKLKMQIAEKNAIDQVFPALDMKLKFTAIAVPNPHFITFVQNDADFEKQEKIATFLNMDKTLFLDGVNVSFIKELKKNHLYIRTFERGVGFTSACGTAMAASSYIYHLRQHKEINGEITVFNPGALVKCKVNKDSIDLIGNATFEFTSKLRYSHENSSYELDKYDINSNEINLFKLFMDNCRKELKGISNAS
ncbi:MAG: Diaminopimelate epimerase [Bacillales bacterium]|jgi:diaminopimelate epimerase|nr:Diaminopimelate epimerase [Bacillales bacterium]